jgi:hypothetical protein
MLKDLLKGGFKISVKKSTLAPSLIVDHLGFTLNLQEGILQISHQKLKMVKKELGKFVTKDSITKRKMSSILGKI